MNWLSQISGWILIPVLFFIVVEDFKFRAVRWWIFPVAGLLMISVEAHLLSIWDILLNLGLTILQLTMLTLYFSIRERKGVNITREYLGWGDIVFWLMSSLLFSTLGFIFFFIGSLMITIGSVLLWRIFKLKPALDTIPLAGLQSAVLIILLIFKNLSNGNYFRNDEWIGRWMIG